MRCICPTRAQIERIRVYSTGISNVAEPNPRILPPFDVKEIVFCVHGLDVEYHGGEATCLNQTQQQKWGDNSVDGAIIAAAVIINARSADR
jgi:hypothetical protein